MNRWFIVAVVLVLWLLLFITAVNAQANPQSILINEIMPNPIGLDSDYEWIELLNISEEEIDLGGFSLNENEITESIVLNPGEYFVIARNIESLGERYDLEDTKIYELNFSLKNSGDLIKLLDREGNIIDTVEYFNSNEGKSLERQGFINDGCRELVQNSEGNTIGAVNENFDAFCHGYEQELEVPKLRFNELNINPTGDDQGKEWIEIKNLNGESLIVNDINLVIDNQIYELDEFCEDIDIFCLVEFEDLTLHNDFGEIELVIEDEVIDSFSYDQELRDGELASFVDNEWVRSFTNTKGQENSIESVINLDPPEMTFSEIYPSPNSNEEEWIEFVIDKKSDLTGVSIHRDSCSEDKISIDFDESEFEGIFILDGSFFTKNLLNAGGTLVLCFGDEELDKVIYPSISKGYAYAKKENSFEITSVPTPGEENIYDDVIKVDDEENQEPEVTETFFESELELISITEAKSLDINSKVKVSGVVTLSNRSTSDFLYIQDETSGIWIDLNDNHIDPYNGVVEVKGILSSEHGEIKIRAEDVHVVNQNLEMEVQEFSEDLIGSLVSIEGEVLRKYSKSFDIDENLRVSLKYFDFEIEKGDALEIKGVLSFDDGLYIIYPTEITKSVFEEEINEENISVEEEDIKVKASKVIQSSSVMGSKTGSGDREEISYPLPNLDKNFSTKELKAGIIIPEFLWVPFLIGVILLFNMLVILNFTTIKTFLGKLRIDFSNIEKPEEYFPRRT